MSTPNRAAVYARISSDIEGTGAGVARQVEDCRKLAAGLGWQVAGEYVDNDISAYSGKRRPEYERMLADLADGLVDGVLVYHIDRLTRRPIELEEFLGALDRARVRQVKFVTGDTDVFSGDGLMMARVMAAMAAKESADKSRRVARKHQQNATEGKPHKGATRPFGYEADFVTVRADEAEVYRQLVARFLAGESTRSLAAWLSANEVPTVTGSDWQTSTLKNMLINPRYAGFRVHRGQIAATGQWDPIITEEQHRQILAKYAEKKNSGRRAPQRYLLSGMLRCGKCGVRLYSSARKTSRRYVCLSGPDHGGCGGLAITADPLERFVADAVLYRLDTSELADTLAGRSSSDERAADLTTALDEATERLEQLALAFANGDISMREWMTARKPIEQRLMTTQRQLAAITHTTALTGLVGNGEALSRSWQSLNLSRQHAIVEALVDHVVIGPGTPGAQALDPGRVCVVWRH
ncbi:recombinase family protein [Nocardioides sp. Arc9.136]|uniref:recombinase family protein n=1 Tax=Nocardioides sp. Arc9.136 TaxID=2996826 RepID=UPI00266654CD|nr:recombinase family protein [Nocardioides sp. Arc9.136]WKN47845.1 recombinase family protein [Nocardioides sp. Arc9.136]